MTLCGLAAPQLLKLSCAERLRTPFYLITDADTFYLRPLSAEALLEAGPCTAASAVCDNSKTTAYRCHTRCAVHGHSKLSVAFSAMDFTYLHALCSLSS